MALSGITITLACVAGIFCLMIGLATLSIKAEEECSKTHGYGVVVAICTWLVCITALIAGGYAFVELQDRPTVKYITVPIVVPGGGCSASTLIEKP